MKICLILVQFNKQIQEPILNNDDANETYELFQSILLSIFNDNFPLQTKTHNKADIKPWIPQEY